MSVNDSAFPCEHNPQCNLGLPNGLSKLEYAAIQIAAGMVADWNNSGSNALYESIPERAHKLALAVLKKCEEAKS